MTFQFAIASVPQLANAYRPGLQAMRKGIAVG